MEYFKVRSSICFFEYQILEKLVYFRSGDLDQL